MLKKFYSEHSSIHYLYNTINILLYLLYHEYIHLYPSVHLNLLPLNLQLSVSD